MQPECRIGQRTAIVIECNHTRHGPKVCQRHCIVTQQVGAIEIAKGLQMFPGLPPPPSEDESPVRICMQETGHSRLRCAADILRGNGG